MSVDFEAIAQRGRCDVSSLRLADPLLRQGYTPPFLARYRRDELGGIDEASLWALAAAIKSDHEIADRKQKLHQAWQETPLADPAIGRAIEKAASLRVLSRLARRLKGESAASTSDSARLSARLLNPQKSDSSDPAELAGVIDQISDSSAAVSGLDEALAARLAGDPRIIAAAVRWLSKNAKVKIAKIHDPHVSGDDLAAAQTKTKDAQTNPSDAKTAASESVESGATESSAIEPNAVEASATEAAPAQTPSPAESAPPEAALTQTETSEDTASASALDSPPTDRGTDAEANPAPSESPVLASPSPTPVPDETGAAEVSPAEAGGEESTQPEKPAGEKNDKKSAGGKNEPKKSKKVSPRQRRRRWLVSVLKPLQGKSFAGDKLSAFQLVMLGRALRSQVAVCAFEYDAAKLVAELQNTAGNINKSCAEKLRQTILENESTIRDAAELAWWDDLQERASARLVNVTGDTLRKQVNRGAVEAKVVLSIDAVGPRTAAATIVSADGRLLHSEDLPCQLSAAQRSAAVLRMGELIHAHHIDLIVISNGPARRSVMVALGDLIKQSPEKSVRWTLAERGGADAYSSSLVADQEMRSTPRRFRAAAWLAFSVLQPAQAMAKVDPLKLRLSSFQRELSEEALSDVLEDIMTSGASRGGVDVNSAPASWLRRLPGMSEAVAQAIEQHRREELFGSRESLLALDQWTSEVESRQSLPFLRVFGSEESLDGTLIHPSDYALAKKLASALQIELPPATPPGYQPPDDGATPDAETEAVAIEVASPEQPPVVEEFSTPGENAPEFAIDESTGENSTGAESDESKEQAIAAADAAASETPEESPAESPAEPVQTDAGDVQSDSPETDGVQPAEPKAEVTEDSKPADAAEQGTRANTDPPTPVEPIKHPLPERAAIEKCVKEWQIGKQRAHQIVHWLCDPFGDSDATGTPPAVLTKIPAMKELRQGDQVIGVVVGVMPFGIFVELAPDCSGLIHVSRVSDSFVEDLHEAVQVGDVVTAWVTGTEEKKRRVGLSALSPEREAELAQQRRAGSDGKRGGGGYRGGRGRGDRQQGDRNRSGEGGQGKGHRSGQQGHSGRGQGAGGRGGDGGNQRRGQAAGRGAGGGRGDRSGRGGKGRDRRGDGRSREKKLESYRVVGKAEEKPITDAMQQGKEPLRSFGDLAQFLGTGKSEPKQVKETPTKAARPEADTDHVAAETQAVAAETSEPAKSLPEGQTPPVNAPEAQSPAVETGGPSSTSTPETPSPEQTATSSASGSDGEASGA